MARYVIPTTLSIPYGSVDSEHQDLVDGLNALALLLEPQQDTGANSIPSILMALRKSLAAHFLNEEQVMADLGYPELAEHKRIHALCTARFNCIFQTVGRKEIELSERLLDEMFDIIVSDVIGADSRFKSFLYAQNILT